MFRFLYLIAIIIFGFGLGDIFYFYRIFVRLLFGTSAASVEIDASVSLPPDQREELIFVLC